MSSEILYDPNPLLNTEDAFYMGQLHQLGFAMPSDEVLRLEAEPVTSEQMVGAAVQHEIRRMVRAAEMIESLDIATFGGMAHNQLRPTTPGARPLQLVLVPTEMPETPIAFAGKWQEFRFQLLGNIAFLTPEEKPEAVEEGEALTQKVRDGCLSASIASVPHEIPGVLYDVNGLNIMGRQVQVSKVTGNVAWSVGHEHAHGLGERAADPAGTVRNVVHRSQIKSGEYRKFAEEHDVYEWSPRLSDEGWQGVTRDPNYLLATDELREAFEAGKADVRLRVA